MVTSEITVHNLFFSECTKVPILVSVEHDLGRRSSPLFIELLDYYVNRNENEEPSYYMTRQCEVIYELQG